MFSSWLESFLYLVVRYKYLAVWSALTAAGFGVPIPEEMTIVVGGYLAAQGFMQVGLTLLVCYVGVLSGDVVTYCIGRYGGRPALDSRWTRWLISRRQLAEVQYYYRRYGPTSLLLARQLPGLRFPAFFTAGMLRMRFWRFLLYDAAAACVSMPLVFFASYWFLPRLQVAVRVVLTVRDAGTTVALVLLLGALVALVVYLVLTRRRKDPENP